MSKFMAVVVVAGDTFEAAERRLLECVAGDPAIQVGTVYLSDDSDLLRSVIGEPL